MPHGPMLLMVVGLLVVLGAAVSVLRIVARQSRRPRVICLMYHRLACREDYDRIAGSERVYTIPTDVFEAQIAYLRDTGFAFVTPDQLCRFVTGESPLPDPSVMITFDDGCRSVVRLARPILARHNARATAFVTTDPDSHVFDRGQQGDPRATDDELRSTDGQTIRFESHALSHRPLRGMPEDELCQELACSKSELERILSRPVEYLAIPGNWFDRRVMDAARQVGYRAVWCSNPGITCPGADPYGLPRIGVLGNMTLPEFARTIQPAGIAKRVLVSWIRRVPGRVLGPRLWLPVRDRVVRRLPGEYVSTRVLVVMGGVLMAIVIGLIVWCVR